MTGEIIVLSVGIVVGLILSPIFKFLFNSTLGIKIRSKSPLFHGSFSGNGYNGRYKKDGSIEFVRVQNNKIDTFIRFEKDGSIGLIYRESNEPIKQYLSNKNHESNAIRFSFKDGKYKIIHSENNFLTDKVHFEQMPI